MKRAKHRQEGKSGLEILEEAAHLFRSATLPTLATYYVGTVPFILGFLYYWVEMSRSARASQSLVEASLAMTALFFWMKLCQASFAARIRAELALREPPAWGITGHLRVLVPQIAIHATGLFIMPLAIVLVVPFGFVYAFYQNTTALADPESVGIRRLADKATKQSTLWILQNHTALLLGLLFAICVLFNWTLVALVGPSLLRTLVGIETALSRNPAAMLNTTFVGILFGLTYLCIDPILKTIYVLRCFYGESLQTGEDLKADLRQFDPAPKHVAVLLALAIGLTVCPPLHAAQATPPAQQEVSPAQLDRQIDEVLQQSKYAWKLPQKTEEAEKGAVTKFFERVSEAIRNVLNWFLETIDRLLRWIFRSDKNAPSGFGWMNSSLLLFTLIVVVGVLLAVFVIRSRRNAARKATVATPALTHIPDINDERVRADELPEDGWTSLARQLMEKGDYRLAMRAYYLATLAHLAQRNLVGIAHFKSNRDYESELRRRAHALPDLIGLFAENLLLLERTWYGRHDADRELVARFASNVDRIRTAA